MNKPIKRHEALKPVSREHHQGLLLCWKIREGFKRNIEAGRIKNYTGWFKEKYLESHFEVEEKYIFPVLGNEDELVQRALAEHRRLRRLFDQDNDIVKSLNSIEEELDSHIRFEERVLFNKIQKVATPEELLNIETNHPAVLFSDKDWKDQFWKS